MSRPPSERAFDPVAHLYDAWYDTALGHTVDELEKDLLYALAMPRPSDHTLDVGTGTGHFALDLARLGSAVIGLDLSGPMLSVARAKGSRAHLLRGDAAALPLRDGRFDLVLSVTLLEFVADPEQSLGEMWRMVPPGGRMVIAVLNALSPWAWARRRSSRRQATPFDDATFFFPWQFVRLLDRFGPVEWNSSVFIAPNGTGLRFAWALERVGRLLLKPFGALLVGRVTKCT